MNILGKAFLSTLVFGGLMYGMEAPMSKQEFSNKYNQFKCFNLTPTNKDEFEILHKELINHIDENGQIFRSFRGLINGIHTQKMKMLPQEFIHYKGSNVPKDKLDQVKNNLFKPYKNGQEIVIVSPDQYVFDVDLGVIAPINKWNMNNNNEN